MCEILTKYNPLIQIPKEKRPCHFNFLTPVQVSTQAQCPLWVEAIILILTLLLFQFIAELGLHTRFVWFYGPKLLSKILLLKEVEEN